MTETKEYLENGNAKFELGQYEDAIKDYDKVIELNPENSEAYCNRGNAKYKLGQQILKDVIRNFDEAVKDFDEVFKLDFKNKNLVNEKAAKIHTLLCNILADYNEYSTKFNAL